MNTFAEEFMAAMSADSFTPRNGKIEADDKWHPAYYADERGAKCTGAYTFKIVDDTFAIGCYFTRKDQDNKFKWHSKTDKKLTAEERRQNKIRLAAYEKAKAEEEIKRHDNIARRLTSLYKKLPDASPELSANDYLKRKGVLAHGIKYRSKHNEIVVPLYGVDGRIMTVQKITPDGGKFMFPGGKKKGCYFPFVTKGEDTSTIMVCEGFATAATVREIFKKPTVAAIDAGNLKPVLEVLKSKFPDATFIICADNDQFTFIENKRPRTIKAKEILGTDPRWREWRTNGYLWNPGIEKANQAAAANGGAFVCWPEFLDPYLTHKPTDFNDLCNLCGPEEVYRQLELAVTRIPVRGEATVGLDDSCVPDQQTYGGEYSEDVIQPVEQKLKLRRTGDFNLAFRCLGHYDGTNYYFSFTQRRIVGLTPSMHNMQYLLQLDNYDNWRASMFGKVEGITDKKMCLMAQNAMNVMCVSRGVFRQEDGVRGAGAWIDDGRVIVNCGEELYVDGEVIPFDEIESEYTYIQTKKLLSPNKNVPLTNSEAVMLKRICDMVTWENPLSGSLLAGWLVIAPVCGALEYAAGQEYRPHIWITGEAESGKSTVIKRIVRGVLGKICINGEKGSSEASIRQRTAYDARPLVYDEAEPGPITQGVIELARLASTGGIVSKFDQGEVRIRFAACFSSINPPVDKAADETRISFLVIRKNTSSNAQQHYENLVKMMDEHLTRDFSDRLVARTIKNMDVLLKNISIFQRAARRVIKSARASEQIGTMLAGLYLLHTTHIIDEDVAEQWVRKYNWNDHTAIEYDSEPVRLLQHLSSAIIRYTSGSGTTKDISVGELITLATEDNAESRALRMHGIVVSGEKVFVANKHENVARLFRNTDWMKRWTSTLLNVDGAEKHACTYFSPGVRTSSTSVPLRYFKDSTNSRMDDKNSEEIPFD